MKIAIVHDYIKEYGGAERVVEELVKIYPNADVFTSIYMPEFLGPHRKRVEQWNIHTTWLQKVPNKGKLISLFRLIAPTVFGSIDLSGYDVVITSTAGTYTSPNFVKIGKKTKLISYCHTPPRYLYGYKTANDWDSTPVKKVLKGIGMIPMHFLRMADHEASKRPDIYIANSEEVKKRIEKYYRRDAIVIYPPVLIPNVVSNHQSPTTNYYLAGGRLARAKGMDVIVKAFVQNGKALKIFGRGFAGFENELKHLAGYSSSESRSSVGKSSQLRSNNIEFLGEVDDQQKFELMAGAKAYVFASYDEDFGITPVEAMGVGTPVVAFRSGGVKETVIDGKTGVFFDKNTPESLNEAIEELEKILRFAQDDKMSDACVARADKFSEKVFDKKIREVIERA